MDVLLVNSDFATSDSSLEVSRNILTFDLSVHSYHETASDPLSWAGGELCLGVGMRARLNSIRSLIVIAPGHMTLKLIHDFTKADNDGKQASFHIGLNLPEFWIIHKLETLDPLRFEVFYTYLAACLADGYPHMSISCVSDACCDYYAHTMLGGFRPRIRPLKDVLLDFGAVPRSAVGIG